MDIAPTSIAAPFGAAYMNQGRCGAENMHAQRALRQDKGARVKIVLK
jgi:hypothetical protein